MNVLASFQASDPGVLSKRSGCKSSNARYARYARSRRRTHQRIGDEIARFAAIGAMKELTWCDPNLELVPVMLVTNCWGHLPGSWGQ